MKTDIHSINNIVEKYRSLRVFNTCNWKIFTPGSFIEVAETRQYWDIASLTKPFAAITALSLGLDVNSNLSDYFTQLENTDAGKISLKMILSHQAAFIPWIDFKSLNYTGDDLLEQISLGNFMGAPPDTYSDLGYILLGMILERVTGNWHKYFTKNILPFLGIKNGFKFQGDDFPLVQNGVGKTAKPRPNDENAYILGRNCAHAGIFTTGHALELSLKKLLELHAASGKFSLLFTKYQPGSRFTCGLDTPSLKGYSSAGSFPKTNTFGHLGFTGTAFWINTDLSGGAYLLTDRVQNGMYSHIDEMKKFRKEFFSEAWKYIESTSLQ
ncbi:MAG: serine hydrolase [Deltaproteobacteria bacterium]|nr:serine hydrolase [Deltaproteobacteria bacterium]